MARCRQYLSMAMSSQRPYLLRAMYDWIVDNGMTPHLLVDAEVEGAEVPRRYVQDGKIVLNVSAAAVQALVMDNDEVAFNARFGGKPMGIRIPVDAVLAVYARENGQGMMFAPPGAEESQSPGEDEPSPPEGTPPRPSGPPSLKIVK
jgi:stringent starvation protein B